LSGPAAPQRIDSWGTTVVRQRIPGARLIRPSAEARGLEILERHIE
jgi:hypothetical protein